MKLLLKYLKFHKYKIFLYLFLYIVFYGLTIYSNLLFSQYIATITDQIDNIVFYYLIYIFVTLFLIYTSHYVLYMVGAVIQNRLMLDIKKDLIKKVFIVNSKTFSKTSTGGMVSRIAVDPDTLVVKLEVVIDYAASAISYFGTLTILLVINLWIGLISVVFLICIGSFEIIRARSNRKNRKLEKIAEDEILSFTNEVIRSEKDIKGQGLETGLYDIAVQKFNKKYNIYRHRHNVSITLWYVRALMTVAYVIVLLYVGMVLLNNGAIVLANFIFIFTNREALQNVVWQYSRVIMEWSEVKILTNRMLEIMDEKAFPSEKFGTKRFKDINGNIEFVNVSFGYEKNKKVLNNISFKIEANQFVAFVGKSGCGKSTILNLIDKFYEPDSGKVLIDGVNINRLSKESLRGNINYLNQFPYIFDLSIRENMKLVNQQVSDDEIIDALKSVDLWDRIKSMENCLDASLGENGFNFSGGQKQRLTIARSFLKRSKIMLFDESTSSLDNVAQSKIMSYIEKNRKNKTIILVAHRLSTIKNADKIFFIENGQITDEGNFDELIKRNENFRKNFLNEKL